MPRPSKCRRVCSLPQNRGFVPEVAVSGTPVTLAVDEYETLRLMDLEGLTQEECAQQMNISRPTVTAIYEAARRKVAEALVGGRPLQIGGGNVSLCQYAANCCGRCGRKGCEHCQHPCLQKASESQT